MLHLSGMFFQLAALFLPPHFYFRKLRRFLENMFTTFRSSRLLRTLFLLCLALYHPPASDFSCHLRFTQLSKLFHHAYQPTLFSKLTSSWFKHCFRKEPLTSKLDPHFCSTSPSSILCAKSFRAACTSPCQSPPGSSKKRLVERTVLLVNRPTTICGKKRQIFQMKYNDVSSDMYSSFVTSSHFLPQTDGLLNRSPRFVVRNVFLVCHNSRPSHLEGFIHVELLATARHQTRA